MKYLVRNSAIQYLVLMPSNKIVRNGAANRTMALQNVLSKSVVPTVSTAERTKPNAAVPSADDYTNRRRADENEVEKIKAQLEKV